MIQPLPHNNAHITPDATSAFALYSRKCEVLPWATPLSDLKDAFMAGWAANDEARKQGDMFAAPSQPARAFTLEKIDEAMSHLGKGRGPAQEKITVELKTWMIVNEIWSHWPIKKARGAAIKAIDKAVHKVPPDVLLQAVKDYADAIATWPAEERQYVPMCSTWINQERWADDRSTWRRGAAVRESQYGNVR